MNEETRKKLSQDLPAGAIKTRDQGGQKLSYIDGHFAITRANDVFGPDGWEVAVRSISEVYRGTRPGKDGENTVIVYEALVAVKAVGVTREDVGIGQCDASLKALAQSIEKGRKEAVTDGIKRALRTFGPSFGLALYDKNQTDVGASFEAQEALTAIEAANDPEALKVADAVMRRVWSALSSEECDAVEEALTRATKRCGKQRRPAPAEAAAQLAPTPQPQPEAVPVAPVSEPELPPELLAIVEGFHARVAEVELPGEAVAVWMKHRSELAKLPALRREEAWKALCRRTEEVGKMKQAKVWLKKAIAEEDARRAEGSAQTGSAA